MSQFIYDLVDPRDDLPFYVGITNDPERRLRQHIACEDKGNRDKNQRIRDIQAEGLQPIMNIVEERETEELARWVEKERIEKYLSQGVCLTNMVHHPTNLHKYVPVQTDPDLLTMNQIEEEYDVSVWLIGQWVKAELISAIKVEGMRNKYYSKTQLEQTIEIQKRWYTFQPKKDREYCDG